NSRGGIGGTTFVPSESDPTATAAAGERGGLPFRHGCNFLDHGTGTRIAGNRQAVLNRILSGTLCELIDAAFECEDVGHGTEPPQRLRANGGFRHPVMETAVMSDV